MKRFFRIGIVLGLPWAWINASDHPTDVNYLKDDLPNRGLTGYCVDLLKKLSDSEHMDFDYEIVPATKVSSKTKNKWFLTFFLHSFFFACRICMVPSKEMVPGPDWLAI